MASIQIDPQNLATAKANIPAGRPVTMINLLHFFRDAEYLDGDEVPCSGREAYMGRYAPAFRRAAAAAGVTGIDVVFVGAVAATIVGANDPRWDAVAVVRYPDFTAFEKIIGSPIYRKEAEPHRLAALQGWRFLASFEPED